MVRQFIIEAELSAEGHVGGEHLVCPQCGGGRSKEKSFVLRRDGARLFYKCFRASCGIHGVLDSPGSLQPTQATAKPLRPYTRPTRPLSHAELEYCRINWHLGQGVLESQGVVVDAATSRLVFPCYTKEGWCWGHQLRSIDGKKPKASLFWHSEYPERLHFPKTRAQGDTLILVEDIPSAIRGETFQFGKFNFCGILGTSISLKQALRISQTYQRAILSLDADATTKAIQYKNKYSLMFDKLIVAPLTKDIKNMSEEELGEFFEGLII